MDDYVGNVEEFLKNAAGPAVLVEQPWNRLGREPLSDYVSANRPATVTSLSAVPDVLAQLVD